MTNHDTSQCQRRNYNPLAQSPLHWIPSMPMQMVAYRPPLQEYQTFMMASLGNIGSAINPNQPQVMAIMPQPTSQLAQNNSNNFRLPRRMVAYYQ